MYQNIKLCPLNIYNFCVKDISVTTVKNKEIKLFSANKIKIKSKK